MRVKGTMELYCDKCFLLIKDKQNSYIYYNKERLRYEQVCKRCRNEIKKN